MHPVGPWMKMSSSMSGRRDKAAVATASTLLKLMSLLPALPMFTACATARDSQILETPKPKESSGDAATGMPVGKREIATQTTNGNVDECDTQAAAVGRGGSGSSTSHDNGAERDDAENPTRKLGIEILGVRLTAAGYLIDLRYRVTDVDKALPWMNRQAKAYLIDEATGAKLYVPSPPKVGPLRQTSRRPLASRAYFMMFANPGGFVKAGAKVTVVVGDLRLENLVVE